MIKTFFSRPGSKKDIEDAILRDIETAKSKILIASAYFNSTRIAQELVNKSLDDKRVILNANDRKRLKSKQVREILRHGKIGCCEVGTTYENYEGTHMHHKFIIIDDVVWMGSYNLTEQASTSNWESMIRIDIKNVTEEFLKEFEQLWLMGWAIQSKIIVNRCCDCKSIVEDPLEHFQVIIGDSLNDELVLSKVQCINSAMIPSYPVICSYCKETYSSYEIFWSPDETDWETDRINALCKNCFPRERLNFRNTKRAYAESERRSLETLENELKNLEYMEFSRLGKMDNNN